MEPFRMLQMACPFLFVIASSTADSVVRNMGLQRAKVGHHTIEATTGADTLLLCHLLVGHGILSVQLLPRAEYHNVVEGCTYP